MMKNPFSFMLKVLILLEILYPFSWLFGYIEKPTWNKKTKDNSIIYDGHGLSNKWF